ncbi:MAG: hypothetical protein HY738_15405, partial [Bacteroidia bacterium]|nr:hypothetical protein [Bacteroidia bacterium]
MTIEFDSKKLLKKTTYKQKIIRLIVPALAIAASLIGVVLLYIFYSSNNYNTVAVHNIIIDKSDFQELKKENSKISSDVSNNLDNFQKETSGNSAEKRILPKKHPFQISDTLSVQIASVIEPITLKQSVIQNFLPEQSFNQEMQSVLLKKSINNIAFIPEIVLKPEKTLFALDLVECAERNALVRRRAQTGEFPSMKVLMAEILKEKVFQKKSPDERISFWDLANAALKGINKIANTDM